MIPHSQVKLRLSIQSSHINCDPPPQHLPSFVKIEDPFKLYRKMEILGKGAFGTVFKVFNVTIGNFFAMKILDVSSDSRDGLTQAALNEAEIGLSMDHPGVCKTHAVYYHDNQLFLIMELMTFGTVNKLLPILTGPSGRSENNREIVKRLMREIADAIRYMHSIGILHRDIKSENIGLFVDEKGVIHAKIMDFGVSCYRDNVPKNNSFAGSIYYMAPESINGVIDVGIDMWAFACLVVELHTGNPPNFDKEPVNITWSLIGMKEPPIPDELKMDMTEDGQDIYALLQKAFEIDHIHRLTFDQLCD
ncbi:MAG: serine/threonine-protein kinase [Euryarchaeota archaeon]|nr:serine/threonine-protein kinase [Euryarchaeota archaeon]